MNTVGGVLLTKTPAMHPTIHFDVFVPLRDLATSLEREPCNLPVTSLARRASAVKDFRADHAAAAHASRSGFAESKLTFDMTICIYRQSHGCSRAHSAVSLGFRQGNRGGFGVGDTHFVTRFEAVQELGRLGILHRDCPDNSVRALEGHRVE